ncbi:BBE domain-containing protein [Streptomyces sp. NBC_00510]
MANREKPTGSRGAYGDHHDQLAAIKRSYDPYNFFHANQDIPPSTS